MKIKRFNEKLEREPLSGHEESPFSSTRTYNSEVTELNVIHRWDQFIVTISEPSNMMEFSITKEEGKKLVDYINSQL